MPPSVFFFTDTPTTDIYTLSLHDALPILTPPRPDRAPAGAPCGSPGTRRPRATSGPCRSPPPPGRARARSEEHTSELQSRVDLVCRLLLEKKKKTRLHNTSGTY